MSDKEQRGLLENYRQFRMAVGVAGLICAAILAPVFWLARSVAPPPRPTGPQAEQKEEGLEAARNILRKATDLASCRAALNHFNAHLSHAAGNPLPALSAGEVQALAARFGLDSGERDEALANRFTALDAHHLEARFLLRDALRSLTPAEAGPGGDRVGRGLATAATAFAWVVRQVRLQDHEGPPLPPAFVLRRGWGNALERSLVFLALLEQVEAAGGKEDRVDLLGSLVFCPGKESGSSRLWACGVVVEGGKDLYLFDPRLGLPVPGPEGVATLAQARRDPTVLARLQVSKDHPYDVTSEQARAAEVLLCCPLSALAPRMRLLESQLLAPGSRVRVSADPARDLRLLEAAARDPQGPGTVVRVWKPGVGVLRAFLPAEEGGADTRRRYAAYVLDLAPWSYFPASFRDPARFAPDSDLGKRLRSLFAAPFVTSTIEAGGPRDLVLRGRLSKAAPELVKELEVWQTQENTRRNMPDLDRRVNEWVQQVVHAYAEQARAERGAGDREQATRTLARLWSAEADPVRLLVLGAAAGPRRAAATYLLALCKHEQAERLEARRRQHPADTERTETAWRDALFWWQRFGDEFPGRPEAPAARLNRARAQAALGDRPAAAASCADLSGPLSPLGQVARLYLARQYRARTQPEKK